jgi:hypothetical protein
MGIGDTHYNISLKERKKKRIYHKPHERKSRSKTETTRYFCTSFPVHRVTEGKAEGGGYVANLRTSADDDSASGSSSLALFRGIRQNGGRLIFFFWFFGKVYKYARLSLSFRKGYTHTHTIQHLREGMTILLQEICLNEIS